MTRLDQVAIRNSHWRYGRWHYQFRRGDYPSKPYPRDAQGPTGLKQMVQALCRAARAKRGGGQARQRTSQAWHDDAVIISYVKSDAFKALAPIRRRHGGAFSITSPTSRRRAVVPMGKTAYARCLRRTLPPCLQANRPRRSAIG